MTPRLQIAGLPKLGMSRGGNSLSQTCPQQSGRDCGVGVAAVALLTYLLRRSDAVPDRAVCFLGRFLPKLGAAFGAAFFLSGRGEWLAAAARVAGRLLCALPSERHMFSVSGTAMPSGWTSPASDNCSILGCGGPGSI